VRVLVSSLAVIAFVAARAANPAPAAPFFQFQNNFWVNLHHVIRGDARRASLNLPAVVPFDTLSPAEQTAWSRALDAYVSLATRSLVFDPELVRINNLLTRVDTPAVAEASLDAGIRSALNAGAPVYRAHGWAVQQQMNEAWIAAMRPRVEPHVDAMKRALASAYHATWRPQSIIVDACAEAGPTSAYTTGGPAGTAGHTTIDVRSDRNVGDTGVEIMFHEASHTLDDQIMATLERAAGQQHVSLPENLPHVLLFYTTGELMRRELAWTGHPDYIPYGDRFQVYKNGWERFRTALGRDWQPYLDGKTAFDDALMALVRDTAQ